MYSLKEKRKKKFVEAALQREALQKRQYLYWKVDNAELRVESERHCHETLLQTSREGRVFEKALSFRA